MVKHHEPKLTREDIAKRDIGKTEVARNLAIIISLLFLVCIYVYPVMQLGYEYFVEHQTVPQPFTIVPQVLTDTGEWKSDTTASTVWQKITVVNKALLRTIVSYEDELKNRSLLRKYLLSPVQSFLLKHLRTGNEKVVVGYDQWLFYLSDMDYQTSPGFLDTAFQKKRVTKDETIQPDPLKCIIDFKQQLEAQGIQFIVLPVPVKPVIYPEKLSPGFANATVSLHNPSYVKFINSLKKNNIAVFDPTPVLMEVKSSGAKAYLKTDTHWSPQGMLAVSKKLSEYIRSQTALKDQQLLHYSAKEFTHENIGDIAMMLSINSPEKYIAKETVTLRQITANGNVILPEHQADVLLLGDSFANIYSLDLMGWGKGAGLVENLCCELKRPVDAIVRNDAGSYATREILINEISKHNRLAGKKVVIWEFTDRELVYGNWKLLRLPTAVMALSTPTVSIASSQVAPKVIATDSAVTKSAPEIFFVPEENKSYTITAKVLKVSVVPVPGVAPYKDHVMSLLIGSIKGAGQDRTGLKALVYLLSMKDQMLTPAAAIRPGQTIKLRLKNWNNVETQYGGFNRSELEDAQLMLQDPCWGELENETK